MDAQESVNLAIFDAFAAKGIAFAPTRTVFVQGSA
jgi:hypothetical protein